MAKVQLLGCSTIEVVHTLKTCSKGSQTKNVEVSKVFSQFMKTPDKVVYIRSNNGIHCNATKISSLETTDEQPKIFVNIRVENHTTRLVHPNSIINTNFGKLSALDIVDHMGQRNSPSLLVRSYGLPTPRQIPERWKKINGFPKYEVSTNGRVRFTTTHKGKILKTVEKVPGSLDRRVTIHACSPNRTRTFLLRDLVLETFVGIDNSVSHSRYIGSNKKDNSLCNLQWVLKEELEEDNILLPPSVSKYKKVIFAERILNRNETCYVLETDSNAVYIDKILVVAS